MSLSAEQKSDLLFKKNATGKATSNITKAYFEELVNGRKYIFSSDIWTQDATIPTTNPLPAGSFIDADVDGTGTVELIEDFVLTYYPNSTAFYDPSERVRDIIPFNFGDGSYFYTIKTNAGAVIPLGLNDWYLDPDTGVLTFFNGFPAGVTSGLPPKITCWKYVGTKGTGTIGTGIYVPVAGTDPGFPLAGTINIDPLATTTIFDRLDAGVTQSQLVVANSSMRLQCNDIANSWFNYVGTDASGSFELRAQNATGTLTFIAYPTSNLIIASGPVGTFKGISYGLDYSANFVPLSLVNKQFVEDLVTNTIGDYLPLAGGTMDDSVQVIFPTTGAYTVIEAALLGLWDSVTNYGIELAPNRLSFTNSSAVTSNIVASASLTTNVYTLPASTGTLALTSQIPSVSGVYLPLAGGTMSGIIVSGDAIATINSSDSTVNLTVNPDYIAIQSINSWFEISNDVVSISATTSSILNSFLTTHTVESISGKIRCTADDTAIASYSVITGEVGVEDYGIMVLGGFGGPAGFGFKSVKLDGSESSISGTVGSGIIIETTGATLKDIQLDSNQLISYKASTVHEFYVAGNTRATLKMEDMLLAIGDTTIDTNALIALEQGSPTKTGIRWTGNNLTTVPYSRSLEFDEYLYYTNGSGTRGLVSNNSLRVVTAAGTHTVLIGDPTIIVIRKTVNAATVVTLPGAGISVGQEHVIKDGKGTGASFNITIDANGNTIDDAASKVINTNWGYIRIVWNGTQWNII